jgi:hypothetical protein
MTTSVVDVELVAARGGQFVGSRGNIRVGCCHYDNQSHLNNGGIGYSTS